MSRAGHLVWGQLARRSRGLAVKPFLPSLLPSPRLRKFRPSSWAGPWPVLTPAVLAWDSGPGHPGTLLVTSRWEFLWDSSAFCPGPAELAGTAWEPLDTAVPVGMAVSLLWPQDPGWVCCHRGGAVLEGAAVPSVEEEGPQPSPPAPKHPVLWGMGWGPQQERVWRKNLPVGPKSSFFVATEGSSDLLLMGLGLVRLSFSQGALHSQPSWEICRESV